MPKCTAVKKQKLLEALREAFADWKTPTLRQRIAHGLVTVNGIARTSGAAIVTPGDVLEILPRPASALTFPPRMGEPPVPVIYADDLLLAADKPSGMLSVATDREKHITAVRLLREWLAAEPDLPGGTVLHAAHRLDREASGVLLFARSLEAKRQLAADWHSFEKVYLAVTDGQPPSEQGTCDVPLREDKRLFVRPGQGPDAQSAITHWRVLRTGGGRALLEVRIETGRKHQIRAHLAHIGCPIVGDLRYGVTKAKRLALHAWRLTVRHPSDGRPVVITASPPPLFARWLRPGRVHAAL